MAKILVVDDDRDISEIIKEYLESDGHHIVLARGGEEALGYMENETFDLIITDLIMPELSGRDLIESIVEKYPGKKILACSGGGDSGSSIIKEMGLNHAVEEGAVDSLTKPFSREELIEKVKSVLSI